MAAPLEEKSRVEILSKNAEKRLLRKQQKALHRLKQREGIDAVDKPTQYLFVANGGLGNGISREDIEQIFGVHGQILDVITETSKPHAFIQYESPDAATRAHCALNGYEMRGPDVAGPGVQLFTAFVETVPGLSGEGEFGRLPPGGSEFGKLPPGLTVLEDVVDEEYEAELLASISWDHDPQGAESSLKHRKVQHYGYEFVYGLNNVRPEEPLPRDIPAVCGRFLARLAGEGVLPEGADQLTVNRYQPGQGIPPHVDTHSAFTDTLVSLSLGAGCVMDFRSPDGRHYQVLLPRRSAAIMQGEARYAWTHGITPRKSDVIPSGGTTSGSTLRHRETRTSFTFRRLRRKPCDCAYPAQCDSQRDSVEKPADNLAETAAENLPERVSENLAEKVAERLVLPRSDVDARRLEDKHVHQVYEDIASHFSSTRHSPWPRVSAFLQALPPHSLVVDVGCGNGKYIGVNKQIRVLGNDRSANLVGVCVARGHEAFQCDVTAVPFRDGVCDACICIAVIHHLSTHARRCASVRELVRLLRPGGTCLIYVWALEQQRHNVPSNYLKPAKLKHKTQTQMQEQSSQRTETDELPIHVNRTNFEKQDVLVPWHLKNKSVTEHQAPEPVFHRFYHVFQEGELERLCKEIENVEIVEVYYDKGNWCAILRKLE